MNIRAMRDDDIEPVIRLLSATLGPAPGGVDRRLLFEWKHFANPAGRSIGLVGEQDGAVCGIRMFMRWTFRLPGEGRDTVSAVRAVDTATDPGLGRQGIFTSLTKAALTEAEREGVAVVFNTPNEKSRPGYLKMGWSDVARWPVWIRVRRPHKLALAASRRRLSGGPAMQPPQGSRLRPVAQILADPIVDELCRKAGSTPASGLSPERSMEFLRWRYADGPIVYHAMTVETSNGPGGAGDRNPSGLLVVRLRLRGDLREIVVCDVIAGAGAEGAVGKALRGLAAEADADHAVAHFGAAWPWGSVLSSSGFRRLPKSGVRFTVRPLGGEPQQVSWLDPASWALGPGDLELF